MLLAFSSILLIFLTPVADVCFSVAALPDILLSSVAFKFLLVHWKFCTTCIHQIHPPTLPRSTSPSLTTQLCVLLRRFFKTIWSCSNTLGCVVFHGNVVSRQGRHHFGIFVFHRSPLLSDLLEGRVAWLSHASCVPVLWFLGLLVWITSGFIWASSHWVACAWRQDLRYHFKGGRHPPPCCDSNGIKHPRPGNTPKSRCSPLTHHHL